MELQDLFTRVKQESYNKNTREMISVSDDFSFLGGNMNFNIVDIERVFNKNIGNILDLNIDIKEIDVKKHL